jgi:hypothetical protein
LKRTGTEKILGALLISGGLFLLLISTDYIVRRFSPDGATASVAAPVALKTVQPSSLADFDAGDTPLQEWKAIDDKPLNGISTAQLHLTDQGANGTLRGLRVTGSSVIWYFPFPFAGAAVPLGKVIDSAPTPRDLTRYNGLRFWTQGDGKEYLVRFQTGDVSDWNFYHATFRADREWKQVSIPFTSLSQFKWGEQVKWTGTAVSALHFVTYSGPGKEVGAFDFQLDQIELY